MRLVHPLFLILLLAARPLPSQAPPAAASLDCVDREGIVRTIDEYAEVLSGPPGTRDWDRLRALLLATTRLDVVGIDADRRNQYYPQSREDYFAHLAEFLRANGFVQRLFDRNVRCAGRIAHVWSRFESRHEPRGSVIDRGWISVQLLHDGTRWRIAHLAWISDTGSAPE